MSEGATMRFVEFDEPDFDGGNVHFKIPVSEAIAHMKAASKNLPNNPNFEYASDEAALDDFVTVHWATITEEQKGNE